MTVCLKITCQHTSRAGGPCILSIFTISKRMCVTVELWQQTFSHADLPGLSLPVHDLAAVGMDELARDERAIV